MLTPLLIKSIFNENFRQLIIQLRKAQSTEDVTLPLENYEKFASEIVPERNDYDISREKKNTSHKQIRIFLDLLTYTDIVGDYEIVKNIGGAFDVKISRVNPNNLHELYDWAINHKGIYQYGLLSLNTNRNIAYFNTQKAKLNSSGGVSRAIYRFITDPTHTISYRDLYEMRNDYDASARNGKTIDTDEPELELLTETANQLIKDIKKTLKIKGEMTDIIVSKDRAYTLLEGNEYLYIHH
jgi:hypothetical protein